MATAARTKAGAMLSEHSRDSRSQRSGAADHSTILIRMSGAEVLCTDSVSR